MAFALLLGACEGVGIVATDNPYTKLSQADVLLNQQGRVMQARRMLDQAIALFEQRGDRKGLAYAYRQYGFLALAGGANADPVVQRSAPPRPGREELDLADGYFDRATTLATEVGDLHLASNLMFLLGNNQARRGNRQQACAFYDKALATANEAEARQPGTRINLPSGVQSFAEGIARVKTDAGCTQ